MNRLFLFLLLCFLSLHVFAASQTPPHILKVGVLEGEPIAYQSSTNTIWQGFAIALWEDVAEMNHWQYEYIPVTENTNEALKLLTTHQLDIMIGAVTVTHDRITVVDFSRPFLMNKIVILKKTLSSSRFISLLGVIFGKIFSVLFIVIALIFLTIAHILWFFERKHLRDLNKGYIKGVLYAMWSMLMLLIGGLLIDKPNDRVSRALVLSVLIVSIIFSSLVSAAFTSSLTLSMFQNENERAYNLRDIQGRTFANVEGQISGDYIKRLGGKIVNFSGIQAAADAMLTNPHINGVVGNIIILHSVIDQTPALEKLQLLPIVLANDEFAFAFPKNSTLQEKVDYAITKLRDDNRMVQICQHYVDESDINACIV